MRRSGFSLIELMIVVSIVGILAAIAIPNFLRFRAHSKMSEAKINIASVRTAQESLFAETGAYADASETPGSYGPFKQAWTAGGSPLEWEALGWEPEGEVHFQYGTFTGGVQTQFSVEARSDVDGDGVDAEFAYIHPSPGSLVGPPMQFLVSCAPTGVYDPRTGANTRLDAVGPCTRFDGQSRF